MASYLESVLMRKSMLFIGGIVRESGCFWPVWVSNWWPREATSPILFPAPAFSWHFPQPSLFRDNFGLRKPSCCLTPCHDRSSLPDKLVHTLLSPTNATSQHSCQWCTSHHRRGTAHFLGTGHLKIVRLTLCPGMQIPVYNTTSLSLP